MGSLRMKLRTALPTEPLKVNVLVSLSTVEGTYIAGPEVNRISQATTQ